MKYTIICGNCGIRGHTYKKCKKPRISLGIIAFRGSNDTNLKILMIRRKDTHGYVEFVRGKYNYKDENFLQRIIDEMTLDEKKNLLNSTFTNIWENLWFKNIELLSQNKRQYSEYKKSEEKFIKLKNGYINKEKKLINLKYYINKSTTNWKEPEWGFPKGRRNLKETDINCALREFGEESGLKKHEFGIYFGIRPFYETFVGTNNIRYRSIYYIGRINTERIPVIDNNNFCQYSEIGDIGYFDIHQCLKKIRPYNTEKKLVLSNVYNEIIGNKLYGKSFKFVPP